MAENKEITGNRNTSSDFFRVLLALKDNVFRSLNVAEICKVNEVKNNLYRCSLINSQKTNIECNKLKDLTVNKDDIVLVIFTNSNYKTNLSRIKNNQKTIDDTTIPEHSKNFGVIVGLI